MIRKICNHPGCNVLINQTETYCDQHKRKPAPAFVNAVRYNERLYNTTRWRTLRREVLREQPNCCRCGIDDELQVHHIVPPRGDEGLFFDKSNLTTVCKSCHSRLTNQEIRERLTDNANRSSINEGD